MCGIAGFVDTAISNTDAQKILGNMLHAISHRGPDARSTFSDHAVHLGHNRLSIIDLSAEANQPFHYDNLSVIFNGEIYNYIEIKNELQATGCTFRTQSDTEVIVAAYKKWGANCVKKFNGMWALAIYDKEKQELFASRDRFGIKPFYYIFASGRFYFASEFKALKQTPVFKNELNLYQISRGLQLGWLCYNDETYFEKIKALPAAHNLKFTFSGSQPEILKYWNIDTGNYSNQNFEEKKNTFYNLFTDSIKLHLRSDVPVATCLSGGLDSSSIVSMVQQLNPGQSYKSFSIYYDGKGDVDEREFIYDVIKKYPAVEPYYFSPTNKDVEENFHHALYHADVPATGSSFLSQYFLMKLIARHKIKVVLDGQGSDEYLGGYMHTFYRIVADLLLKGKISEALSVTVAINRNMQKPFANNFSHLGKSALSLFNSEQSLYTFEYRNYHPFLSNVSDSHIPFKFEKQCGNKTDNFLYHLTFNSSLPSLLQYEDRNSMAFSIESRVPFLDHRLVEMAFSLRNDDKINRTTTKYILRESLKNILPEKVYSRKDKKGFVTPGENKWLRGPLQFLIEDDFSSLQMLNKNKVLTLVNDYKKGNNKNSLVVWRIAVLNYWLKNFM